MKPSKTQCEVLAVFRDHPGTVLYRMAGGFWTYRGCPMSVRDVKVPSWYVDVRTVRAMERQGMLRRLNVHPEEWRDERGVVQEALPVAAEPKRCPRCFVCPLGPEGKCKHCDLCSGCQKAWKAEGDEAFCVSCRSDYNRNLNGSRT